MQKVLSKLHLLSLAGLFFLTSCSGVYEGSQEQKQDNLNEYRAFLASKWQKNTAKALEDLSLTLPADQAIVVGRLMMASGKRDLTQDVEFIFNPDRGFLIFATPSYVSVMNKEGYFCVVLPAGKNTFGGFRNSAYAKWSLPEESLLSFEVEGNGKITYIGDVLMNFGVVDQGFVTDFFVGRKGRMQIAVNDNAEAAVKFFSGELRTTQPFTSSLIRGGTTFDIERKDKEPQDSK